MSDARQTEGKHVEPVTVTKGSKFLANLKLRLGKWLLERDRRENGDDESED